MMTPAEIEAMNRKAIAGVGKGNAPGKKLAMCNHHASLHTMFNLLIYISIAANKPALDIPKVNDAKGTLMRYFE